MHRSNAVNSFEILTGTTSGDVSERRTAIVVGVSIFSVIGAAVKSHVYALVLDPEEPAIDVEMSLKSAKAAPKTDPEQSHTTEPHPKLICGMGLGQKPFPTDGSKRAFGGEIRFS